MPTYLKIENPGVCPTEGFILLGATSKRLADNDSPYTIGQFGSGNKHAVNVLLRAKLYPIIFCGNHRLEYGTKPGKMMALEGQTDYNRVIVKHGGTDEAGASVTFTEELSQTDEYGVLDWNCMGMAFREFVSNAIDAAIAVNRQANGKAKWPWGGVKVELVTEDKVRAKRGYTRVFVPADNEEVTPTADAVAALDWCWEQIALAGMDDGKVKPPIRCFRKVMNGGTVDRQHPPPHYRYYRPRSLHCQVESRRMHHNCKYNHFPVSLATIR